LLFDAGVEWSICLNSECVMYTAVSYRAVDAAMSGLHSLISPAEAHGTLTGLLCAGTVNDCDAWLATLLGNADHLGDLSPEDQSLLDALFDATRRVLDEEMYSLDLFLPDEEAPLSARAQALGEWCRGFLYGLGASGSQQTWPQECREIVRDVVEIARLDQDAEGEADEAALMELTEYVRVGAQMLHSELRDSGGEETETLH
jgi:uncharacterized protein